MKHRIFVYGSLKKGFGNNRFLATSEYVGETQTPPNYNMVSFGVFPGVCSDGTFAISGEIYYVDNPTLIAIDRLEANGFFYTRELVEMEDGHEAWIYLFTKEKIAPSDVIGPGITRTGNVLSWRGYR